MNVTFGQRKGSEVKIRLSIYKSRCHICLSQKDKEVKPGINSQTLHIQASLLYAPSTPLSYNMGTYQVEN